MKSIRILKITLLVLLISALAILVYIRYQADLKGESIDPTSLTDSPDPHLSDAQASNIKLNPSPSPIVSEEPFSDKPKVDITTWELKLVNSKNLLESSFIPELTDMGNGQSFDSKAVDYLELLLAAAKNEGYSVYITSSYRSYKTQETLFKNKVNQYLSSEGSPEAADKKARTIVAYPGSSEHQLGLACDITDKYYEYMNESLADTELLKWMKKHCAEYGFILRYPEDKQDITGVMFEPWHFRYVGITAAAYIMQNNLCLEEFLDLY